MGKPSKGGGDVAGFRYSLSMLMGLGRGPVDEIIQIKVGDLVAWTGSITTNSRVDIDAPELFGGDKKEGGIGGSLDTHMGGLTQSMSGVYAYEVMSRPGAVAPPSTSGGPFNILRTVAGVADHVETVATAARNYLSSLRGVTTLFFDGLICSNNPYPKKWEFRTRRSIKGWYNDAPWYPDEAKVVLYNNQGHQIIAQNPAHIVYECLTNPEWGRGLDPSELEETSFISAANALCREQFGLCMAWSRTTDLGEFLQQVFNHIGGGMYQDRNTGLINMKLLRKDYVAADLPLFTYDTGLLRIDEDQTTAPDNSHSELIVNWLDPVSNTPRQTRVQNLAGTQASQTVVSTKTDYLGLPTSDLAARVAQRDMAAQSPGIKRFTLRLDRRGRKLTPLSVFRISVPDRNISEMVLRVGKIEEGPITDQTITVVAVQDVFSMETTTYLAQPESAWAPPDRSVIPIADSEVSEINYRDTVRVLSVATLATVPVDSGDIVTVAKAPTSMSVNYELETAATGEAYADHGSFVWTPTAQIVSAVGHYATSITLQNDVGLSSLGTLPVIAWLEDELVEVTSYNSTTKVMTIGRGCVDTIPAAHSANARIWFPEHAQGADGREYTTGENVRSKLLTRTNTGVLDISLATEVTSVIIGRQGLPYNAGNFKLGGTPFANVTTLTGDVVVTWADRDRITQSDHILVHGDASTGPEAGTTYRARIYDRTGTLKRTTTGLTGTTWTYDTTMQSADALGSRMTIKFDSQRGGLSSFQPYDWTFSRVTRGYGEGYGYSYGKA